MSKKILAVILLILAGTAYLLLKPGNRIHYELPEWKAPAKEKVTRISWGKAEQAELRLEEGEWVLGTPARRADSGKVDDLLAALEAMHPTDMVSQSGYYAAYELEEGARTAVTVTTSGGTAAFQFGMKASSSQGTYALLPGEKGVLLITGDWNSLLPADPGELRDKSVLTFDSGKVDILELTAIGESRKIVYSRQDDGTWLKNGENFMDKENLESKIASLASLKCQSFVTGPPPAGDPLWKALLSVGGEETGFTVWEERDGSYLCGSTLAEDLFLVPSYTINGLSDLLGD
jgi:hypothetical protein